MTSPLVLPGLALALLPEVPRTFSVAGPDEGWREALIDAGLTASTATPDLVVATEPAHDVRGRMVLAVAGVDGDERPAVDYDLHADGDVVTAVPVGERYERPRRGPGIRGQLSSIRRRVRKPGRWTVISPDADLRPAAVRARALDGPVVSVRGGTDPRRRVALRVAGHQDVVLKVAFDGSGGRGGHEQSVLHRLHNAGLGAHVPTPLGAGQQGVMAWSAEGNVEGEPLEEFLAAGSKARGTAVLEELASWLGDVAEHTRGAAVGESTAETLGLRLRDRHRELEPLLTGLGHVPTVLAHGDLATGLNVLVGERGWSVIDWETAVPTGLPLLDLLPTICLGVARQRGHHSTSDEAGEVSLGLVRGDDRASRWLFDRVDAYIRQAGVPRRAAGALGALAWGHLASMRHVHAELLAASGRPPVHWTTGADAVATHWMADERLGEEWPAFHEAFPSP